MWLTWKIKWEKFNNKCIHINFTNILITKDRKGNIRFQLIRTPETDKEIRVNMKQYISLQFQKVAVATKNIPTFQFIFPIRDRLQDKVGRWLSKCQQMSTGVGGLFYVIFWHFFQFFQGCIQLIIYLSDQTTNVKQKRKIQILLNKMCY